MENRFYFPTSGSLKLASTGNQQVYLNSSQLKNEWTAVLRIAKRLQHPTGCASDYSNPNMTWMTNTGTNLLPSVNTETDQCLHSTRLWSRLMERRRDFLSNLLSSETFLWVWPQFSTNEWCGMLILNDGFFLTAWQFPSEVNIQFKTTIAVTYGPPIFKCGVKMHTKVNGVWHEW